MITAERVREILIYDPASGAFTYRVRTSQRTAIGTVAGSVNSQGYRQIRVDGRSYKAHRLAWLIAAGSWPLGLIDHINGDPDDNRICNLRNATRGENLANSKIYRKGKQAPKGLSLRSCGRWAVRIQKDGRPIYLGTFDTIEKAASAYRAAAANLFGAFGRSA